MVARNCHIEKFHASYLFPEIGRRRDAFLKQRPNAQLISLGVGDTTQPLPTAASEAVIKFAQALATGDGYQGYGPEQGALALRQGIAERLYSCDIDPSEIFVSDGAKCDIGRLQHLFGPSATVALQDPAYPVYVDTSVLMGRTESYNVSTQGYGGLTYLPCTAENGFFPDLDAADKTDVIFFCSPNNPTGAVATREQLEKLVAFAKSNSSIIVFDAAYAPFIQDETLPRSIFEIEGAREVAIEVNSFSKLAGFTGVRLGWTVVPKELAFNDGSKVIDDWRRLSCTLFNGASNLAQAAGIGLLTNQGMQEVETLVNGYMENARILREAVTSCGLKVYGGKHAPYLWVAFPGRGSWNVFQQLMDEAELITTPGVGFGPAGEGFVRLSALGNRRDVETAAQRLVRVLKTPSFQPA